MGPDQKKIEEAHEWLEKAVRYETDGKPAKFVDMAFNKALKLENEAFGVAA